MITNYLYHFHYKFQSEKGSHGWGRTFRYLDHEVSSQDLKDIEDDILRKHKEDEGDGVWIKQVIIVDWKLLNDDTSERLNNIETKVNQLLDLMGVVIEDTD